MVFASFGQDHTTQEQRQTKAPSFPPAPPLPPPQKLRLSFPPSAIPKVDSLMQLLEPENDGGLSKDELNQLKQTDPELEAQLANVRSACQTHRNAVREYQQALQKEPRSRKTRALLARNAFMYQFCVASTACPGKIQEYIRCWSEVPPEVTKELLQTRTDSFVCQSLRQSIQRCTGDLASKTVRATSLPEDDEALWSPTSSASCSPYVDDI